MLCAEPWDGGAAWGGAGGGWKERGGGEGLSPQHPPLLWFALLWFCSGWILSLIALRTNKAVAVMMILVSLLFTAQAVLGIIMLKRVSVGRGGWV